MTTEQIVIRFLLAVAAVAVVLTLAFKLASRAGLI
jgi:hypothetical protein